MAIREERLSPTAIRDSDSCESKDGTLVSVRRQVEEEFPGEIRITSFIRPGEVEQRFEPQVGWREDLVIVFREPYRKQRL